MEKNIKPEISPLIPYKIHVYNASGKVSTEYVLLGNALLDQKKIDKLNNHSLDPEVSPEIKKIFREHGITHGVSGSGSSGGHKKISNTVYSSLQIEHFHSLSEIWHIINRVLGNLDSGSGRGEGGGRESGGDDDNGNSGVEFYMWVDNENLSIPILTHSFYYQHTKLDLPSNPFIHKDLTENEDYATLENDRLFSTFSNLNVESSWNYLLREYTTESENIISIITRDELSKMFPETHQLRRYFPQYPSSFFPDQIYYNLEEAQCLNNLLRTPLDGKSSERSNSGTGNSGSGSRGNSGSGSREMIKVEGINITQCIIHINMNGNPNFLNLYAIFQLIPLDDNLFFTKIKRDARSISKISKNIQKISGFFKYNQILEWTDIEKHERGLLYRKIKESQSPGLVIYNIHQNGSIELKINWTEPTETQEDDIKAEIIALNKFIRRLNGLKIQLVKYSDYKISLADPDFFHNPLSQTRFASFNFNSYLNTYGNTVVWNRFQNLVKTWEHILYPIINWKIYNKVEFRRVLEKKIHFLYLRSNNVSEPHPLYSVLYSMGILGSGKIGKEQSVGIAVQKSLLLQHMDQFWSGDSSGRIRRRVNMDEFEEIVSNLKEKNHGIVLSLGFDGVSNRYILESKGVKSMTEISDIVAVIKKMFQYYFHIERVFKLLSTTAYDCKMLNTIIHSQTSLLETVSIQTVGVSKTVIDKDAEIEGSFLPSDDDDDNYGIGDGIGVGDSGSAVGMSVGDSSVTSTSSILETMRFDEEEVSRKHDVRKEKSVLDYLKDVSDIFSVEYARFACPKTKPIVMSLPDFWKNYGRLFIKMLYYINQLTAEEQKGYYEKFEDENVLIHDSKDSDDKKIGDGVKLKYDDELLKTYLTTHSIEQTVERLDWIKRKLTDKNDIKNIGELKEILLRYDYGLQTKVPLTKDDSKLTNDYFYFCPIQWCSVCRLSRTSDEITDDRCNICHSSVYTLKEHLHIGFSNPKQYKHLSCLPCCYIKERVKKKKDECLFTHPTKEIKTSDTKILQLDHIATGKFIERQKFGCLDVYEHYGKLNDFFNYGVIYKNIKPGVVIYLRQGSRLNVPPKDAFLEVVSRLSGIFDFESDKYRQWIISKMTLPIFLRLNNGMLATIFLQDSKDFEEAFQNFLEYLATGYLNEDILWHFLSMPGILNDNGFNIVIIQKNGNKYTLLAPPGINIEEFYNPMNLTGVILKTDDVYQLIIRVTNMPNPDKSYQEHSYQIFVAHDPLIHKPVADLLYYASKYSVNPINEFEKNRLTLEQTVDELEKVRLLVPSSNKSGSGSGSGNVKGRESVLDTQMLYNGNVFSLYFNHYMQITHIIIGTGLRKNECLKLPIKSLPLISFTSNYPLWLKRYNNFYISSNDIPNGQWDYTDLTTTWKLIKKLEGTRFGTTNRPEYYMKNDQEMLTGIRFQNKTYMPFKKTSISEYLKLVSKKIGVMELPILLEQLPEDIDQRLKEKVSSTSEIDQRVIYSKKTKFQKESYERLRFELSHIISTNKQIKKDILQILENGSLKIIQGAKKDVIVKKLIKLKGKGKRGGGSKRGSSSRSRSRSRSRTRSQSRSRSQSKSRSRSQSKSKSKSKRNSRNKTKKEIVEENTVSGDEDEDEDIDDDVEVNVNEAKSTFSLDTLITELKGYLLPIIQDIAVMDDTDMTNYVIPKIRNLCQTIGSGSGSGGGEDVDPHCIYDKKSKMYKLVLPTKLILPHDQVKENSFDRYAILLAEELIRNQVKRSELLDGKVDYFSSIGEVQFEPDREIFIGDREHVGMIQDLYKHDKSIIEKLEHHYFKQPSEVFARDTEQVLFLLHQSWYEKVDFNPDEIVYNRRNIYDMLAEVLNHDINHDIWSFIYTNTSIGSNSSNSNSSSSSSSKGFGGDGWKYWLNALRQLVPDEYENIYSDSQFREHIYYDKGFLSVVHLNIISHLYNIKIIVLNEEWKQKFVCLGNTHSNRRVYLLLYYLNGEFYLIGQTPHINLSETNGVVYVHREDKLPPRFIDDWKKACGDTDNKTEPDSVEKILKKYPESSEMEKFYSVGSIKDEKIIPPPGVKLIKLKAKVDMKEAIKMAAKPKIQLKLKPKRSIILKQTKKALAQKSKSRSQSKSRGRSNSRSRSQSRGRSQSRSSTRSKKVSRKSQSKSRKSKNKSRRSQSKSRSRSGSRKNPKKGKSRSRSRPTFRLKGRW